MRLSKSPVLTILAPLVFLAPLAGCFVSHEKVVEKEKDNPRVVEHDKTVIEHDR